MRSIKRLNWNYSINGRDYMARDNADLKKFRAELQKLGNESDELCKDITNELASRLLRKVKKRTPVYRQKVYTAEDGTEMTFGEDRVGGTLRRGWKIDPQVNKDGNKYSVDVFNSVEYAPYVEYGHRQQVGRFVPQIGKRLKKGWVNGRFMMTISVDELEAMKSKLVEKRLNDYLKGVKK